MTRVTTFTRCQTLRLDQQLDDLLTEAAYDHRTSKSSYVRSALRNCLGIADRTPERLRRDKADQGTSV